jgi:hypothetical protein
MRLQRPSHATLIAYLALFVALGGTVYAAGRINGKQIKPKSTPGNRLKPNSVTGKQVKESSLRASAFLPAGGGFSHPCAGPGAPTNRCAHTALRLKRPSRIVAIANGGWAPVVAPQTGAPNSLRCNLEVDGKIALGPQQSYGETAIVNHDETATTPLALAGITAQKLKPGTHKVQLFCDSETDVVERPTITAFAISSG